MRESAPMSSVSTDSPVHVRFSLLIAAALAWAMAARATTVIVLRSADGTALSVAADSMRTVIGVPGAAPLSACKITRISPSLWVALAGINDPENNYYPDQIALGAGLLHRDNLDAIVEAFRERASELLPLVMERIRAGVGKEAWEKDYEGWPATQVAFFGLVNHRPVFRLMDLIARTTCAGISIYARSDRCPGKCVPRGTLAAGIGSTAAVSRFPPPLNYTGDLDAAARWLVSKEIELSPDCGCGPPIVVLHLDAAGARWVGDPGMCGQGPRN
jgi:hypothetical protein